MDSYAPEDDPETASWLDRLTGDAEDFDWDDGNQTKHAKHDVAPKEIEEMLRHPAALRRQDRRAISLRTTLVLGTTDTGRHLALIITRRGDKLRPIGGRPMRRKERSVYEEACRQA